MNRRRSGAASVAAEDVLLLAAVPTLPWIYGRIQIFAHRLAALVVVAAAAVALVRRGWNGLGDPGDRRWLLPALLLAIAGVGSGAFSDVIPRYLPPGESEAVPVAQAGLQRAGLGAGVLGTGAQARGGGSPWPSSPRALAAPQRHPTGGRDFV